MIDKQKILNDLNEYFEYTGKITVDDLTDKVSVAGPVYLKSTIKHTKLPVQFAVIGGDFDCSRNSLQTLIGSPISVGGGFYFENNSLKI
jgi:hypothetical protein